MACIRYDPFAVREDDMPALRDLPPEKAQRKINEIRNGAEMCREYAPFPAFRPWKDIVFGAWFLVLVVVVLGSAIYYSHYYFGQSAAYAPRLHTPIMSEADCQQLCAAGVPETLPTGCHVVRGECKPKLTLNAWAIAGASICGASGAVVAAFFYTLMCHQRPDCVVYTSLFFGPAFCVAVGIGLICAGATRQWGVISGLIFVVLGVCQFVCVFFCWKSLIPFTIQLTMAVASVIEEHPSVIFVSLIGGALSTLWTTAFSVVCMGVYTTDVDPDWDGNNHPDQVDRGGTSSAWGANYVLFLLCAFVFSWGCQVAWNICHVTYCGVFGRFYYGATRHDSVVVPSLHVALTTSYGSICLGGLLVATVRAVEAVVKLLMSDARSRDGGSGMNIVVCLVGCVLQCFVDCLGDILEFFNEWAYVQCAIRGVSFCEAARITYTLCTCANMQYILSSLLLNSLVFLGSMLCAAIGSFSGGLCGYLMSNNGSMELVLPGLVIGFLIGVLAGSSAITIINSGAKTILVCWAENQDMLRRTHPELHMAFTERVKDSLEGYI